MLNVSSVFVATKTPNVRIVGFEIFNTCVHVRVSSSTQDMVPDLIIQLLFRAYFLINRRRNQCSDSLRWQMACIVINYIIISRVCVSLICIYALIDSLFPDTSLDSIHLLFGSFISISSISEQQNKIH